jgi:hypothetical protein
MYFISNINDVPHFPDIENMISFILKHGIDLNYIDINKNLGHMDCGSNGYLHYLFEYSTHPPHYSLFKNYYRDLHFKHHNDGGFPLIKLFKKSCTENILSILNILLDLEYDIVDFTIIDTRIGSDNYNKNILTIFQWIGCSDKKSVLKVIDKLISRGVDPYHIYRDGLASHRMIDILPFFIREHIEETALSIKEPSEE